MRTCRTFDGQSPITEIVDRREGMASRTPFDILEVAPLPHASRHLVIPTLLANIRCVTRDAERLKYLEI